MPLQKLSENQINGLANLSYELSVILADELKGEQFHPKYKENKDAFSALMRSHTETKKALRAYLKQLAQDLVAEIDWRAYQAKAMKAQDTFIRDLFWKNQKLKLQVIFQDTLEHALKAGISAAHDTLNLNSEVSTKAAPAIEALRNQGLDLAKQITQTTKDKVKQSLATSISLGEPTQDAAARLQDIIDDPYRAELIANTESVRAYAEGKLAVADEVGAQSKTWNDGQPGACEICAELDGQTVDIDQPFESSFADDIMVPGDSHPNCRCLLEINMASADDINSGDASSSDNSDEGDIQE